MIPVMLSTNPRDRVDANGCNACASSATLG